MTNKEKSDIRQALLKAAKKFKPSGHRCKCTHCKEFDYYTKYKVSKFQDLDHDRLSYWVKCLHCAKSFENTDYEIEQWRLP